MVARNTLVLLPAAPDTDVPAWFFERTAAEVKAEFMSLLRSRQTKEVFASKAWKELKLGATSSSGRQPATIMLRIRFPEVGGWLAEQPRAYCCGVCWGSMQLVEREWTVGPSA